MTNASSSRFPLRLRSSERPSISGGGTTSATANPSKLLPDIKPERPFRKECRQSLEAGTVDLIALRYALLAAEHLSFRQAASALDVRQSAVSRRVRALEDRIGVSLFERHRAGVRVTEAGKSFLQQVGGALGELDYAIKSAGAAGRGAKGSVRIGISSGFLRQLVRGFAADHPGVAIDIQEGAPRSHIARVREHRVDVAFVTGEPQLNGCDVVRLWSERVFVVLPETHPLASERCVSWEMLRDERFIVKRSDAGPEVHDYVIQRFAGLGHHPHVERYAVGRETLMHLVAFGFGVSITNEAATATRFPEVVFRPIATGEDALPFSAVWSPANDNPVLRRFLSLARRLSDLQMDCDQRAASCVVPLQNRGPRR